MIAERKFTPGAQRFFASYGPKYKLGPDTMLETERRAISFLTEIPVFRRAISIRCVYATGHEFGSDWQVFGIYNHMRKRMGINLTRFIHPDVPDAKLGIIGTTVHELVHAQDFHGNLGRLMEAFIKNECGLEFPSMASKAVMLTPDQEAKLEGVLDFLRRIIEGRAIFLSALARGTSVGEPLDQQSLSTAEEFAFARVIEEFVGRLGIQAWTWMDPRPREIQYPQGYIDRISGLVESIRISN